MNLQHPKFQFVCILKDLNMKSKIHSYAHSIWFMDSGRKDMAILTHDNTFNK